eukprot:GHVS01066545.1.p3 GENE.GHVS01066545.1~~GHVS01066545.1.p3  ORF type:complete len:137 (-),score=14.29 GHVS01066545.1:2022-2432(-)
MAVPCPPEDDETYVRRGRSMESREKYPPQSQGNNASSQSNKGTRRPQSMHTTQDEGGEKPSITWDPESTTPPEETRNLLQEYKDLFYDPEGLPPPYRMSPKQKEALSERLGEWESNGWIRPSRSGWGAGVQESKAC